MKYTYLISILLLFYIVSKNNVLSQTYTNRVKGDLADPFIYSENGTYYMYGTDYSWAGFWVYTSKDLVKWSIGHECLHSCPTTYGCAFGTNNFWAPDLIKKDGFYYLFYTADYGLCVARSSSPEGPFVSWGTGSLWTNQQNNGQWAIDPDYFKDDDGKEYMYYARIGQYGIWVADISADLQTLTNHQLCFSDVSQNEAWVSDTGTRTNEAPAIIKQDGKYYLFYSFFYYIFVF